MILTNLPAGSSVFVDANILVYHVGAHPDFGQESTDFLKRVEQGVLQAVTTTHVMSEVAHKTMLLDASRTFGWPLAGTLKRLQSNPLQICQLVAFRMALEQIRQTGVQVLVVAPDMIDAAADVSQQTGLMSNDALIVAAMRAHGLTCLASHDADFDRVPGLKRYAPA